MEKESKQRLKEINTQLKIYINESTFISNSCRNKVIRLLGDAFDISLPIEDFQNIDVSLLEDGSIVMRDEVYKCSQNLTFDEVLMRYESFKEKADSLLERKGKGKFQPNDTSNMINIFIVLLILGLLVALSIYTIRSFISGNFIQCIWLILFLSSFLLPSLRERFLQAYHYIRRKFRK